MAGKGVIYGMGNRLYTPEQVELLEQVYNACRKPSRSQRLEMINEYPYLSTLESKQIKLWFQKRRFHEKQKKKDIERMLLKQKLDATQQLLLAENTRIHQDLLQLENENEYIQELLQNASSGTTDVSCESACNHCSTDAAAAFTGSLLLAEENGKEFLSRAKQSAVGWFPIPKMKALHFIVELVEGKSGTLTPPLNKEAFLLSSSQKLTCLNGDGWSLMNYDVAESLIKSVNSIKNLGTISSFTTALSFPGSVLCLKVSLLLKCAKSAMATTRRTKHVEDNDGVPCLVAQAKPGSSQAIMLSDWICKSFRGHGAEIKLPETEVRGRGCGISSFRAMLLSDLQVTGNLRQMKKSSVSKNVWDTRSDI